MMQNICAPALGLALALGLAATPGHAAGSPAQADAIAAVLACRGLADSDARLRCFDGAGTQLATAAGNNAEAERRARRALFGLRLGSPSQKMPEGQQRPQEPDVLEAKLVGFDELAYGYAMIVLDEGGSWRTTEPWRGAPPRNGSAAKVIKGPLGSFMVKVGNLPGRKAVRVR